MLENRDGEGADAVRLSTLHAAKGLEFPHVFIVGLEEGILPHRESVDAGDVEEERRLMYVGVTRAQQSLHLSWCRARKRAGEQVACQPSRFIGELAQEDLRYADAPLTASRSGAGESRGQRAAAVAEGDAVAMKRGSVRRSRRSDGVRDERAVPHRAKCRTANDDSDVSIARALCRARRRHALAIALRGTAERYVILEGTGRVEVGDDVREVVHPRRRRADPAGLSAADRQRSASAISCSSRSARRAFARRRTRSSMSGRSGFSPT